MRNKVLNIVGIALILFFGLLAISAGYQIEKKMKQIIKGAVSLTFPMATADNLSDIGNAINKAQGNTSRGLASEYKEDASEVMELDKLPPCKVTDYKHGRSFGPFNPKIGFYDSPSWSRRGLSGRGLPCDSCPKVSMSTWKKWEYINRIKNMIDNGKVKKEQLYNPDRYGVQ